jgi:hypothetical protein
MSRLRHPVRAVREPFGKAGLIVAVCAIVLALTGAAFAAGKLTGPQKKEVEKIAKKFRGTGPAGAPGAPGANGTNGKDGTNGENGASVIGTAFSGNQHGCKEGGVEFKAASTTYACNGEKGKEGPPGPLVEALPSGSTLKGVWTLPVEESHQGAGELIHFSESFTFPLSQHPIAHYIGIEQVEVEVEKEPGVFEIVFEKRPKATPAGCLGDVENPGAEPGNLCVFATRENNAQIVVCSSEEFNSTSCGEGGLNGFLLTAVPLSFNSERSAQAIVGVGTWAVTAE